MLVADTTVYADASVPPNFTEEAAVNPVPVIVTIVPGFAFTGANEVMVGNG